MSQSSQEYNNANEWYMHNPESLLEIKTHKFLWDFDIQTDYQISARRPDLVSVNKETENLLNCGNCRPGRPQSKIEGKLKER